MAKLKDGFKGSRAIVLPVSVIREMEQDQFESKLHITDIGYYPKAHHHFRKRERGSTEYIFIFCMDGSGWFECNGKRHEINPNQFFILPPNTAHSYGADKENPWSIYWLHFKGEMASFYGAGYDKPITISVSDESRIMERMAIFEELYTSLEKGYSKENLNLAISGLYYFLGSIKYMGNFRESSMGIEYSKDVIERSILFMKENIERRLTLTELCAFVGYSESYFSNIFRRHTGYSPINYFNHLKIQTACNLLDFSDMRINQICFKVGISDPYYFTKLFTKIIGYSPSHYRNMKKG